MKFIRIGDKELGNGKVFLIAEVGSNHASSLDIAIESIERAHWAGADAVKFQSINIDALYHNPNIDVRNLHKKIDFPESWYKKLKSECDKLGLVFLSSPTYLSAVGLLESVGVELYKIASAQVAVYPQLIERVAALGKPVVISSGLATENELSRVVDIFHKVGNEKFIILHCNSVYPANPDIVHLPRMLGYQKRFSCAVGFSDHTVSDVASIASVAMGAAVIERHFTISKKIDSPDAELSLEPQEFRNFVSSIREAELICRNLPRDSLEFDELAFKNRIQHNLVATREILSGQIIDQNNSDLMRGNDSVGIDAWTVYEKREIFIAKKDIQAGSWITWEFVERSQI
ncbi:N-acetylneuraminate synthase family protein [Polynucleobacter alcilacus]|uniref:N-acetylneuraminate synthase family protein n=1 Tax=Polynucleobacter alcilacus TaxID=1819739 RepID=UPI001C0C2FD2|nr:N-acetylneuraminate synthase family protein [Polynucleobacter alcilacus]MBU3568174.1 N-acetylneuraminate synthase family protein [Polynucleobacter alcilacus]